MRVLFDQATPVPLCAFLEGHIVRTPAQEGWNRLRNGDLLAAAEQAGFEVLLTTDKKIAYQQNFTNRKIALIVLGKQQCPFLRPHAVLVVAAVNAATTGSYVEVEVP